MLLWTTIRRRAVLATDPSNTRLQEKELAASINYSVATKIGGLAFCNTLYKCISKLLCSRLSEVLLGKNISAQCLMKIDLSKAYDTVDWDFVADLLKGLCFPSRLINWILVCLRGTSYSLMLNGRVHGSFKSEKGLRQGDPISPLLFVLVMEYLTRLLIQAFTVKGNPTSLNIVQKAFEDFCCSTGLAANMSKSSIYFGGVDMRCKKLMLDTSKLTEGADPSWYFKKLMKLRNTIDKDVLMAVGYSGKFKAKKFYLSLISAEKVTYHKTVWHKLKVSKHRFILWQAIIEKLLTRDQLARFITLDSSICRFMRLSLNLIFICSLVAFIREGCWLRFPPGLEELLGQLVSVIGCRNQLGRKV
uniref:Reverse transcriptase domain-containing protein n=1 Tax=Cannabis sativa TaxID=3483 RepID=A0A803QNS5_CANSA